MGPPRLCSEESDLRGDESRPSDQSPIDGPGFELKTFLVRLAHQDTPSNGSIAPVVGAPHVEGALRAPFDAVASIVEEVVGS